MTITPPPKPHNEPAEQAVLGAILTDNAVLAQVQPILRPDHFFIPAHARIFEAAETVWQRGQRADPLTLKTYFEADGDLEHVGGVRYLIDLVANTISSVGALGHAQAVVADWVRRQGLAIAQDLMAALAHPVPETSPQAELATAETRLFDLRRTTDTRQGGEPIEQTTGEILRGLVVDAGQPVDVTPTGLTALDRAMGGGLFPASLICVSAPAKAGKTALGGTLAYNLTVRGVPHAYVALEMGARKIVTRMAARALGVNPHLITGRRLSNAQWSRVAELSERMADHCRWLNLPGSRWARIEAALGRAVRDHGIQGAIIDYWQLIPSTDPRVNRVTALEEIGTAIATATKSLGIWIVLFCQENEEGKTFGNREGLARACELMWRLRPCSLPDDDGPQGRWFECVAARDLPAMNIGDELNPAVELVTSTGPYLRDWSAPVARQ